MSEDEPFVALLWESLCKAMRGNAPVFFNINHFNAPGSQLVNSIQTQNIASPPNGLSPNPFPGREGNLPEREGNNKGREKNPERLPVALRTEAAMALWRKAQEAGYVDGNFQPTISRTLSAILANEMAVRLDIPEKWKTFEGAWNRRNMYRDYYKALNMQQALTFQDEIKRVFR